MVIFLTTLQSQLHASIAVLIFGLVLAVFGHIISSRTLILTGILLIGAVSVYFLIAEPH